MTKKQAKRLQQWRDQLGEIERQLLSAHADRSIWERVRNGVLKQHPEADAHFIASYSRAYVVSQITRIETLAGERGDARSIPDLLRTIRKNADVVSRDHWVEMVSDDPSVVASDPASFYDTHLGDDDGKLSARDLRSDAKSIRRATKRLPGWSAQCLEHLDRRNVHKFRARDIRLAYDEIDEALEVLTSVAGRLQLLLKGRRVTDWTVDIQADWQEPLRASLFPFEDVSFLLPPSGDFS